MARAHGEDQPEQAARARDDRSVLAFLRRFSGDFLRFDGRGLSSLRSLVLRPGLLESAVLDGAAHGVTGEDPLRPVHPVRLYLAVNLLFFLALPWLNTEYGTIWSMDAQALATLHPVYQNFQAEQAARLGLSQPQYDTWFDLQTLSAQGAFVALMIPISASWLWLFFHRRRRYFVDHLMLATSSFTVFLLWLIALGVFARIVIAIAGASSAAATTMALALLAWFAAQTLWFYGALRRFYDLSRGIALLLAVPVFVTFLSSFYVYMHVLFWSSWLTLRSA